MMEHVAGNRPHQNIKHCKDNSRNLSFKPGNKSFITSENQQLSSSGAEQQSSPPLEHNLEQYY
jgi:hypothetical protein